METLSIYSLNSFYIEHTAVLIIFVMLYIISSVLTYLKDEVHTF